MDTCGYQKSRLCWNDCGYRAAKSNFSTMPVLVERFIGSVRRECLDHVVVLTAAGLRRILTEYVGYYERSRTHLSLNKDAPIPRPVAGPSAGCIVAISEVGGLHHRYECRAA